MECRSVKKFIVSCLLGMPLFLIAASVPAPEEAGNVDANTAAYQIDAAKLPSALEVPYISTYYVEPNVRADEPVKIKFYITDWHQSEYRLKDWSKKFNVQLRLRDSGGKEYKFTKTDIPAGDHTFEVGILPEGDYLMELYGSDEVKRNTPVIYHEFRVRKSFEIPQDKSYFMTADDLAQYSISNKGDYGVEHYVDATGKNVEETKAIVEAEAAKLQVPAGKYLIVIGGSKAPENLFIGKECGAYNMPKVEFLPNHYSLKSAKVLYSDSYDKTKVEAEAVQTGNGLNKFLADKRAAGMQKVILLPGVYRISSAEAIKIPSGLTLDLNGATIKLNGNTEKGAMMVKIDDCVDSHVVNGIVEGDYYEHDYSVNKSSEWVSGIEIVGQSKYCSFKNMVVRFITGYGVCNGFKEPNFTGFGDLKFQPGTLDRNNGEEIEFPGLQVSQMVSVKLLKDKFGYLTASRTLGYQGRGMDEWNLLYHFFDKDKKYLKTVDGEQYRRVKIPNDAEFVRVTVWSWNENKEQRFQTNFFKVPQNCVFENIYVQNARCVGVAPSAMYNHKFANLTVTRSGENLARCAFDAEDGWDMMQDVWIYRNRFIGNPNNELLTCAGHNFVFEENEATLHLWSRTASYVIRNNRFKGANYGYAGRTRSRLVRIEDNNSYSGKVTFGEKNDEINPMEYMSVYSEELSGNRKTLDGRWMLAASGDFADKNVMSSGCGVFVGAKLDKNSNSNFNMLFSILSNSYVKWLANSNFLNSILENVNCTLYKSGKKIVGCKLVNVNFDLANGSELTLENCTLENVEIKHGYWVLPAKVTLINCEVKNTDKPLFQTPSYSVGEIKIENCLIDSGKAPAFFMYDLRAQKSDSEVGIVTVKNSDIVNESGFIIGLPKNRNENKKTIKFNILNTKFKGEAVATPQANWQVNVSDGETHGVTARGWNVDNAKLIEQLITDSKEETNVK